MSADNLLAINRTGTEEQHEERGTNYNEKLDALNKRISELEAQLEAAKSERNALLETAAPLQRPFAPFLERLPEDVIREIFIACIDPETNPTMSNTEAPTLLTQISSGLRRIALAASELWAAIHIPIIETVPTHISHLAKLVMDKRADGVKEWLLRRSGNLPLRISIRKDSRRESFSNRSYVRLPNDIMDVFISCCSRWRDIFLAISQYTLIPRLDKLRPDDVPLLRLFYLLRSFYLTVGSDIYDESYAPSVTFLPICRFLAGPNLRRFCANMGDMYDTPGGRLLTFPIIWKSLTHLGLLGSIPVDGECITLCSVLRQCPRLVSLKITLCSQGSPSMGDIVLPTLQFLTVQEHNRNPSDIPGVLAVIRAPALHTLVYNVDTVRYTSANLTPPMPNNLLAMLKWAPDITQLTLGKCSTNVLVKYAQHCPLLTYLYVDTLESRLKRTHGTESDDPFLFRLFLDDDCLCPRLDHFRCSTTLVASLETSRNIVHRKNGAIPHLARWKALKLYISCDPRDDEEIEKLDAEVIAGKWKAVDIHFSRLFQISRDLVDNIGHHVHLKDKWPTKDAWPLGEWMTFLNGLELQTAF